MSFLLILFHNFMITYPVSKKVLIVSGKTLVKPQVVPPIASDEVTKPHVRDFMRKYIRNQLLVKAIGISFFIH